MRNRVYLSSVVFSGLLAITGCAAGGDDANDNSGLQSEVVQTPSFVRPAWATTRNFVAAVDPAQKVSIQVHLQLRNFSAAVEKLYAVNDPTSSSYGKYLTDAEFDAAYGPTAADVAAVTKYLQSQGLTVGTIPDSKLFVPATGTAAQLSAVFGTKFANYSVDGIVRRAPMSTPVVPAALKAQTAAVLGLTESRMVPHNLGAVSPATNKPAVQTGCDPYFGASFNTGMPAYGLYPNPLPNLVCPYTPAQVRKAYGFDVAVNSGDDGTGVTVAIVDAYQSPTLLADAQQYATNNDPGHPLNAAQFTAVTGPGTVGTPDPGWYTEQSLDVEAVHGMAPGANILFVGAVSPQDLDLIAAVNYIVEGKKASVISNSYGEVEAQGADFVAWQAVAVKAGLAGIGLYFSSGDNGDEVAHFGSQSADFPASLPYVTAVGGTSMQIGADGKRLFETGWETSYSLFEVPPAAPAPDAGAGTDGGTATVDGGTATADAGATGPVDAGVPAQPVWVPDAPGKFLGGAGGGTSYVYAQPRYQKGVVPTALANLPGAPARVVPDVAMLADPYTGFLIGLTQDGAYVEGGEGGTSLACPLFAATMALAQQHKHHSFGFANTQFYAARKKAFRDVTDTKVPEAMGFPGAAVVYGFPGLLIHTAVGYDDITGIGTPDGSNFIGNLK